MLLSDFWLAKVVEPYRMVHNPAGETVHGVELDDQDEYLIVQYMHFVCSTAQGGRKYEIRPGYPQSVLWQQGAVVPYKIKGIMQQGTPSISFPL